MSDIRQLVALNLKKFRMINKMKASEVARKAHISRQFYHNIETGRAYPSLETLQFLANSFQIPAWKLLLEENSEAISNGTSES